MSLITLHSDSTISPTPARIQSTYRDPLKVKQHSEVGLVSLAVKRLATYIVDATNDRFYWRLGLEAADQIGSQRPVILTHGVYTGEDLATHITTQMNAVMPLNNFIAECDYYEPLQRFDMGYSQSVVPVLDTTVENYSTTTQQATFINNGTATVDVLTSGFLGNSSFSDLTPDQIITTTSQIYADGGRTEYILKPFSSYSKVDYQDVLKLKSVDEDVFPGPVSTTLTIVTATGVALGNGWELEDVANSRYFVYLDGEGSGKWGVGSDGTLPASELNSDIAVVYWSDFAQQFQDTDAGGRGNNIANTGVVYSYTDATAMAPNRSVLGYGQNRVGFARNYLRQWDSGGDPGIQVDQADGMDVIFTVGDNATFDDLEISFDWLTPSTSIIFPNVGWRAGTNLFSAVSPLSMIAPATQASSNWTLFNYGVDNVKAWIEINQIGNIEVKIAHDTGGDLSFLEEEIVAASGGTVGVTTFDYFMRESFYPLVGSIVRTSGDWYNYTEGIVSGNYADSIKTNSRDLPGLLNIWFNLDTTSGTIDPTEIQYGSGGAMELSNFFRFGEIYPSDGLPAAATGGLNNANIDTLIGMERFDDLAENLQTEHYVTSTSPGDNTIAIPNVHVHLEDFNIKTLQGKTKNTGKVVAVLPAEEFATNQKKGVIHWMSTSPIMLDMNLESDISISNLTLSLKDADGKLIDYLLEPTTATLLVQEGPRALQVKNDTAQQEMMEAFRDVMQTIKINNIGVANPKF